MTDTLALLRDALRSRDKARTQVHALDNQATADAADSGHHRSHVDKARTQLTSAETEVGKVRENLSREIAASRSVLGAAEGKLRELNVRHDSGEVSDSSYRKALSTIRTRISDAEARVQVRERAQAAESAKDLDWLIKIPTALRRADTPPQTGEEACAGARFTDWPGASVPERVMMLWRESKKAQSRRPIVISGIIVGALALLVLGVVVVGGAMSDKTVENYLGRGEVLVPVLVEDMQGVRSVEFTLRYDPELLTAVSIIQDEVGRLSVMQYDIDAEGRLQVSVRDVTGITGTGAIVIIRFRANDIVEEQAVLEFVSVTATDSQTLQPRPVLGENGWVNTSTLDVYAPVLRFPRQ